MCLPIFMAMAAMMPWVWSGVEMVTASILSPISSKSLRKSLKVLALGCLVAAALRLLESTSHRATISPPALYEASMSDEPLPVHPMEATRIFSLAPLTWAVMTWGKARVLAATVPLLSRVRREVGLDCWDGCLDCAGMG